MDKKELENLEKLKELSESVGGLYLIEKQREVVIGIVDNLANSYQDKTHTELITLCAKLSTNLSLLQLLSGITEQIQQIKELYKQK